MNNNKVHVLQLICPTGFYGAERWILALAHNSDPACVRTDLAVTKEGVNQNLEILNHFKPNGGKTFTLSMTSRFDMRVLRKLGEIISERRIDIIHTHGYKSDILGLLAARQNGIKCISTPHGFGEPKSFKHRFFISLGTYSLRYFDAVAPLSKQLYDECAAQGVPAKKLDYIQNGVDLLEVEAVRAKRQNRAPAESDKRVIGFIGQMIPRKKIRFILDIFDRLAQQHPNVELRLLGDGSSRNELEAYAKTLQTRDRICFLGFVNNRLEHLAEFDLFVMTSSSEGIPRCLMEAMGMGTPVAAFNIPGIDQLLEHNLTGMLAPFGDSETLYTHWEALLYNKELALRIGNQAREFVNKHFSGKAMANNYEHLYKRVLEHHIA